MSRFADGDHPDTIVVTYGRCNKALELVTDCLAVWPPTEWRQLAMRMLDRELLADDEWWFALERRRRTARGLAANPSDLPSYSTRVTAGHLLMAAHQGHESATGSQADIAPVRPADQLETYDYQTARRIAYQRSGGVCEADGLHHRHCPRNDTGAEDQFITHHVYPRARAKRDGLHGDPIVDHPANLLVVWNGHTRLGAGGCHGRIHREQAAAKRLGLLADDLQHVVPSFSTNPTEGEQP